MSVWLSAAVLLHNKQAIKLDYTMACDYKLMCFIYESNYMCDYEADVFII